MHAISGGLVGFGSSNTSPTAQIDAAASTTSVASVRIRSGTAPTSPNDGEVWTDSTTHHLYGRLNGTIYQLDQGPVAPVTVTVGSTIASVHNQTTYVNSASATNQALPTAGIATGFRCTVLNISTGAVTVTGTINGVTNYTALAAQYKYATFEYNGTAWYVVANN